MYSSLRSYIGRSGSRQLFVRAAAVGSVALLLGGCASVGLPLGETDLARVSGETTGSIPAKASVVDQVDPSDWEAVRRAVAAISPSVAQSQVEWANPDTGSTGTIATSDPASERAGTLCRPFATTVSDVRGVSRYRGEACQRSDGRWQLYGMIPDDAHFS
jgi:surface antigen